MREIEAFLKAAQNNATSIHVKARIDKTQQNSRCRFSADRDETNDHVNSECNELEEYKD